MKINIQPETFAKLQTIGILNRGIEFSGLGFCEVKGDVIEVYDFVLMDFGSEVYTEIDAEQIMKIMERPDFKNCKVWVHAHPVGNGQPGPWNWSGTDNATIKEAPLGGHPQMVKWSVSMVRTPLGWVGRIDNHIKNTTQHLEVFPKMDAVYQAVQEVQQRASAKRAQLALKSLQEISPDDWDYLGMDEDEVLDQLSEDDLDPDEVEEAAEAILEWLNPEYGEVQTTLLNRNGGYTQPTIFGNNKRWY